MKKLLVVLLSVFLIAGLFVSCKEIEPDGPKTVQDILNSVSGGFPGKASAWKNETNLCWLEMGYLNFSNGGYTSGGDLANDTPIIKSGTNFTCTKDGLTYTFNMDGNVLVSITVSGFTDNKTVLNGTYSCPM